jgi:tetratricopeptide (TPR) repeat protein
MGEITPPLSPENAFRYFELGEERFQSLCHAIMRNSDEVAEAKIYGTRGQGQYGIDVLVTLKSGEIWAIQSKSCLPRHSFRRYREAIADFWKHRDLWIKRGVTKFIVALACGVRATQILDKYHEDQKLFSENQLGLQLWDSDDITDKLRIIPGLALTQLGRLAAELICGPSEGALYSGGKSVNSIESTQSLLLSEISANKDDELDRVREQIRMGFLDQAEVQLHEFTKNQSWALLPSKVRARALKMIAAVNLNKNNLQKSREYLERAKACDPSEVFTLVEVPLLREELGVHEAFKTMPAPNNREEWHLHIVLLFGIGKVDDALAELKEARFGTDAETHRLRALAFLSRGEFPTAKKEIEEAEKSSPKWKLVREASALIDYFSALVPAFEGKSQWDWPLPVEHVYVRNDKESVVSLRSAAQKWRLLASDSNDGSTEWARLKAWELASLSNSGAKSIEVQRAFEELLRSSPYDEVGIIWALERGLRFDRREAQKALRERIELEATIRRVQICVALLSSLGEFEEAYLLTQKYESLYNQHGLESAWRLLRAQLLFVTGKSQNALELCEEQKTEPERLHSISTMGRMSAQREGWTVEIAKTFDDEFRCTGSAEALFRSCEAHLFAGNYDYVIGNAENLLAVFPTSTALTLILEAAANAGRWKEVSSFLDSFSGFFGEEGAPPAVRRMKAEAFRQSGRLLEATVELESIGKDSRIEDRTALFNLFWTIGNMDRASFEARNLLSDSNTSPKVLLHLANALKSENPELAQTLVSETAQRDLKPSDMAAAASLMLRLDLDESAGPLFEKAVGADDDRQAEFRQVPISEVFEIRKEMLRREQEQAKAYEAGRIPVHLFSCSSSFPLSFRFHFTSEKFPNINLAACRAYIRHGSIRRFRSIKFESKRIYLDLTSILLADQLGILCLIEECAPIEISPRLIETLNGEIDYLSDQQPSIERAKTEVDFAIDNKLIEVVKLQGGDDSALSKLRELAGDEWCQMLQTAKSRNGSLLVPKKVAESFSENGITLPPEVKANLVSLSGIINLLERRGFFSESELSRFRGKMSADLNSIQELPEQFPRTLVISYNLLVRFALAGGLRALLQSTKVVIGDSFLRYRSEERQQSVVREEQIVWLKRLREHVRTGLEKRYFMVANPSSGEQAAQEVLEEPYLGLLVDFTNQSRGNDVVSCIDDRFLGNAEEIGKSPVIDVLDILVSLKSSSKIDSTRLFGSFHVLRRENFRYIPLSSEELLFQLSKAEDSNGDFVETAELKAIRRYYSGCLIDWSCIQKTSANARSMEKSEVMFGAMIVRVISKVLIAIWNDQRLSIEQKQHRSDWLLLNLWLDIAAARTLENPPQEPIANTIGMGSAHLILEIVQIGIKTKSHFREAYLEWLFTRIDAKAEPSSNLMKEVRRLFLSFASGTKTKEHQRIIRAFLAKVIFELPTWFLEQCNFSRKEIEKLGLSKFHPIHLGKVKFDSRDFWPAISKASLGEKVVLSAVEPKVEFKIFGSWEGDLLVLKFEHPEFGFASKDRLFALVSPDKLKQDRAIEKLRSTMDFSKSQFVEISARIRAHRRVDNRAEAASTYCAESFNAMLGNLMSKLKNDEAFEIADILPLNSSSLLRHIRVDAESVMQLASVLPDSASVLLKEEGLEEAVLRFAALPIRMPECLVDAFRSASAEQRTALESRMRWSGPIARSHLCELLWRVNGLGDLAASKNFASLLSNQGKQEWDLFSALLRWSYSNLVADSKSGKEDQNLVPASWIHAARLNQVFGQCADPIGLAKFFKEHTKSSPARAFDKMEEVETDVCNPRYFDPVRYLLSSVIDAVEERDISLLPKRVKSRLSKICFPFKDESYPLVSLLPRLSTGFNIFGSFLPRMNEKVLESMMGERAKRLSEDDLAKEVKEILGQMISTESAWEQWSSVITFFGSKPPSLDDRDLLLEAIRVSKMGSLIETKEGCNVVMYIFSLSIHYPLESIVFEQKFEELIISASHDRCALSHNELGEMLANCAFHLAFSAANREMRAARFGKFCLRASEVVSDASDRISKLSIRLLIKQTHDVLPNVFREIIRLRNVG